jgi:hypothetical protein
MCAGHTQEVWPLTEKYQSNICKWEERYKVRVQVYSGRDCLDYVAQVDACPDADCAGLLQVYQDLAAAGNWIKMVDIGTLCVCVCVCVCAGRLT